MGGLGHNPEGMLLVQALEEGLRPPALCVRLCIFLILYIIDRFILLYTVCLDYHALPSHIGSSWYSDLLNDSLSNDTNTAMHNLLLLDGKKLRFVIITVHDWEVTRHNDIKLFAILCECPIPNLTTVCIGNYIAMAIWIQWHTKRGNQRVRTPKFWNWILKMCPKTLEQFQEGRFPAFASVWKAWLKKFWSYATRILDTPLFDFAMKFSIINQQNVLNMLTNI